jgi:hypothetical protein
MGRGIFMIVIACALTMLTGCIINEEAVEPAEAEAVELKEENLRILTTIHIIAGETTVEAVLYDNETAQAFVKMLPLTVDLWTPIHYAQAFDLPERIPELDERTRVYERGAIGYWYEGPSIALLYGKDETRTAVPIVKIGKMSANISVFETYRDAVTIELVEK